MKTVTDHIRAHLLSSMALDRGQADDLIALRQREWSPMFEALMRNRLVMGAIRYGPMTALDKPVYDYAEEARRRLSEFSTTGNTELLVDAANLALLEFEVGQHPNKHWAAIDDGRHATPNHP